VLRKINQTVKIHSPVLFSVVGIAFRIAWLVVQPLPLAKQNNPTLIETAANDTINLKAADQFSVQRKLAIQFYPVGVYQIGLV
jgi:hypothetical protein